MGRTCLALAALMLVGRLWAADAPATAGPPPPVAPVDRHDPAAVVKAYVDACARGDIDGALALISADAAAKNMVRMMVGQIGPGPGEDFRLQTILTEVGLLPIGTKGATPPPVAVQVQQEGAGVTVVVAEQKPRQRTFVLTKAPDGTWSIDLEKSMMRNTGLKESFFFAQMRQAGNRPDGAQAQGQEDWRVQQALRRLSQALQRYLQEHGDRVPDAANWMDEVEKFSLDGSIMRRPGLAKGQYGWALNAALAGKPLPKDWQVRQGLVLLYETDDLRRNAAGDPNAENPEQAANAPPRWVATASGNVQAVPHGATLSATAEDQRAYQTCEEHLSMLGWALLAYARDHDGTLPPAKSWCDDIGPYLKPQMKPAEVFKCPATPDLQYGYAINSELAGMDVRVLEGHEQYVLLLHAKVGVRNESLRLPAKAEAADCLHSAPWSGGRKGTEVLMLDGSTSFVQEGQPYPQPPIPGR